MRVGLVLYGTLDTPSGGYLYDRKLVDWLRRCGDSVELLSMPRPTYLGCLAHNGDPRWAKRVGDLNLDVLVEDELNHPSLLAVNRTLRKRFRLPLVALVHHLRSSEDHPAPLMPLYRAVERQFLSSVDGFLFNSGATRAAVERLVGHPARGAVAYPAGDRFGPPPGPSSPRARTPEDPLRLLFLGNLIPRKGLHVLLKALATLTRTPWELTVVGSLEAAPSYAKRMQREAADQGLAVRFLGSLPDGQVRRMLETHHVLVVPSQYEGFGIVYLEAMGFGVVPVATRSGAAGEIIDHGKNGILIDAGDWRALALELSRLAGDGQKWQALSRGAQEKHRQFPGWDQSMAGAREFLESMATNPGRP